MLVNLVDRARWPWPAQRDVVWLPEPAWRQAGVIALGGRMYHVGADCIVNRAIDEPAREPFEGMRGGKLVLRSGKTQVTLRIERSLGEADKDAKNFHTRELARLGLKPAKESLNLRLEGLDQLVEPHKSLAFLRNVLAARFRELSAAKTKDPGPGRRWRNGLVERWRLNEEGKGTHPPPRFHTRQLSDLPTLGFLHPDKNGKLAPTALQRSGFDWRVHRDEDTAHRKLLGDFVAGLVTPLPRLPRGARSTLRLDDTFGRDGLDDHDAIDLGSWIELTPGNFGYWPAGTPVRCPHQDGKPWRRPRQGARSWIVEVTSPAYEPYCLRVLLAAYHLSDDDPPRLAAVEPGQPGGGWTSSEPLMRALGVPKGNHLHLEVLGIYETAPRRRALFLRLMVQTMLDIELTKCRWDSVSGKAAPEPFSLPPLLARPGVRESGLAHELAMTMPWFGGPLTPNGRATVRGLGFTIHLDGLNGSRPRFRLVPPRGTKLPIPARLRALCRELLVPAASYHRPK